MGIYPSARQSDLRFCLVTLDGHHPGIYKHLAPSKSTCTRHAGLWLRNQSSTSYTRFCLSNLDTPITRNRCPSQAGRPLVLCCTCRPASGRVAAQLPKGPNEPGSCSAAPHQRHYSGRHQRIASGSARNRHLQPPISNRPETPMNDAPTRTDGGPILGLDVGGTKTAIILGDAAGRVLARHAMPLPLHLGPAGMVVQIVAEARRLLAAHDSPALRAVGVAIGGPLDSEAWQCPAVRSTTAASLPTAPRAPTATTTATPRPRPARSLLAGPCSPSDPGDPQAGHEAAAPARRSASFHILLSSPPNNF